MDFLRSQLPSSTAESWLVLMDLGLPGLGGLEAIRHVLSLSESLTLITVSGNDDDLQVSACLGSGSFAFISKAAPFDDTMEVISQAIHGTLQKGTWLSARGIDDASRLARITLTDRQIQVLAMICQGSSNRDIADKLGITEITAKSHVGSIFRSLGVASRTQAVLVAQRLGLSTNNT